MPFRKLLICSLFLLACRTARPDAMSADEHRSAALAHYGQAKLEDAQYDPNAQRDSAPPVTFSQGKLVPPTLWSYNPTDGHRLNAEREREHARDHLAAAAILDKDELEACRGVAVEARAACPLVRPYVDRVEETARGAVLHFKQDTAVGDVLARMRCHLAYARVRGFKTRSCLLYERGVDVRLGSAPQTIAIEGATSDGAAALRADLRELFHVEAR